MAEHGDPPVEIGAGVLSIDEAAGTVAAHVGRLRRLLSADEALFLSLQRYRNPWRTFIARSLTTLGDAKSWSIAGVAFLASRTELGTRLGLRLATAAALATLASQALKRSLTRARPDSSILDFEPLAPNPDRFSFPSGHTAAAFAVAVAFAGEPFALGPASLLLAVGIGLSRVYLGAHYPLDVGAGALLGGLGGLAARLIVA